MLMRCWVKVQGSWAGEAAVGKHRLQVQRQQTVMLQQTHPSYKYIQPDDIRSSSSDAGVRHCHLQSGSPFPLHASQDHCSLVLLCACVGMVVLRQRHAA